MSILKFVEYLLTLDEISEYDVLTDEEEKELFIKAKNGDEKAIVKKGVGVNLGEAFHDVVNNTLEYINQSDDKVKWIKLC